MIFKQEKMINHKKGAIFIEITIIDAPCGSGKTEYIIRKINQDEDTPYLYIAPLRSMFNRLDGMPPYEGRGAIRAFHTPTNRNLAGTKLQGLKQLIEVGCSIMSTHALFLSLDNEAVEMLKCRNYHLVVDEALDAVTVLSKSEKGEDSTMEDSEVADEVHKYITNDDISWLLKNNLICIDRMDCNKVVWIGADGFEGANYRYKDVERIIKSGAVSYARDSFLIWTFPIAALQAFSNITVLTYRFSESIMRGYLDFYGMTYRHMTIERDDDGYKMVPFYESVVNGSAYADLINVCDSGKLNAVGVRMPRGKYPLSSSWYEADRRSRGGKAKAIRNNITNYFRNYCNANRDNVGWTVFKRFKGSVQPTGYTRRSDKSESFIHCTCRATEDYKDRYNLAYLIDRHLHPGVVAFLGQRDIAVDNDQYALSELIQWIFRSRIRNDRMPTEDRKINVYVPSERMRNLLLSWLICK